MLMPLKCRHCVVAVVLLACSAPLRAELDLLATYSGKYSGQSRFERALKEIQESYDESLKAVQAKLGLAPAADKPIQVVVRDAQPADPPRYAPFTEPPFQTRWHKGEVLVVLHAEFIINGRYDVAQSLAHELVHAVMRTHMTPEAYKAVPTWLREGLAVWSADQIEQKVAALYRHAKTPVDWHIKGVADTTNAESFSRYAEYGLTVELIEKQKGEQAVQALVAAIVAGTDAQAAVEKVTGLSWEDFVPGAKTYAKSRLRELEPAGTKEFNSIRGRDRGRDYAGVIKEGTQFMRSYRDSPLAGNVLYYMVKAHRLQKRRAAAKNMMRKLEGKHAHDCDLMDEAVYQIGAANAESKQWRPAIHVFEELLRDHPDSNLQDRALYYLALCHTRSGNKKKAKEYIELFDRSFPKSKMGEKMAKLRGELP